MGLLQGAKTFVDEIIATSAEKEVLEETASKLMKKMELLRRKGRNKARMRAAAELQKAPQKLFEGLKKRFFLQISDVWPRHQAAVHGAHHQPLVRALVLLCATRLD